MLVSSKPFMLCLLVQLRSFFLGAWGVATPSTRPDVIGAFFRGSHQWQEVALFNESLEHVHGKLAPLVNSKQYMSLADTLIIAPISF